MATNPIYVESEEEIPELVERLRRYNGDDTMLVLPIRSRIGQSRFNFQLLRNYASSMGKRVTVVCDDPAVQKMASESGFAVFGAVGVQGEGIPSEPEAAPPPRRWWDRGQSAPSTHIGIAAPTRLITKNATELRPGRFLLYVAATALLLVGLLGILVYVPTASVTLVAPAQAFSEKGVEIQAQPGKAPIRVRAVTITRQESQGFKTTGAIRVLLAPAAGTVVYTNSTPQPSCQKDPAGCVSPGIIVLRGQRVTDQADGITFAQTSNRYQGGVLVPIRSLGKRDAVGLVGHALTPQHDDAWRNTPSRVLLAARLGRRVCINDSPGRGGQQHTDRPSGFEALRFLACDRHRPHPDRRLSGLRLDLDPLLREGLGRSHQRHRGGRHVDQYAQQADQQEGCCCDVKQESPWPELGRILGNQPGRRRDADMGGRS